MDIAVRIAREVADREGVQPTDLPPLYETIDPDALTSFVESAQDGTVTISFTYYGYGVTVSGDGTVEVDDEKRSSARQS